MKKALQALDNPDEDLSMQEQIEHTSRCLTQIGDHIESVLTDYDDHQTHKEWKQYVTL